MRTLLLATICVLSVEKQARSEQFERPASQNVPTLGETYFWKKTPEPASEVEILLNLNSKDFDGAAAFYVNRNKYLRYGAIISYAKHVLEYQKQNETQLAATLESKTPFFLSPFFFMRLGAFNSKKESSSAVQGGFASYGAGVSIKFTNRFKFSGSHLITTKATKIANAEKNTQNQASFSLLF